MKRALFSLAFSLLMYGLLSVMISGCSGCSGCKNQSELDLKRAEDLAAVEEQRRRDSIAAVKRRLDEADAIKKTEDSLAIIKAKQLAEAKARNDTTAPDIQGKKVEREFPVDTDQISESTADLEDELRPTIEAAKRRLDGVRGYISFKLIVAPTGRVKEIKWEHNDLDAQAVQAIQATVFRHRYPTWDASKLSEYKTSTIKFSF